MAAEEGHTAIVQMLLDHNADVNAKDMLRMTALHWAVERCHIDTVSLLLAAGADVLAVNKFDKTSLDIACENSYEDIILQLIKAKSEVYIYIFYLHLYIICNFIFTNKIGSTSDSFIKKWTYFCKRTWWKNV